MNHDNKSQTLFYPFRAGLLGVPERGSRWLFCGAAPGFVMPDEFPVEPVCVQANRADFLALQRQKRTVVPVTPDENFDGALVLLGRYRQDNIARLHAAARTLRKGGLLVVAGGKTDGVDPLRKHLRDHLGGHASKFHGVVFWLESPPEGLADILPSQAQPVVFDGMTIPPGGFSADGPDPGSVLLARHFDDALTGSVADFGAGWGYLGVEALKRSPAITRLDSFEADWHALEACRVNVSAHASGRRLAFHWADLLTELPDERYDQIIMNPPFHRGRAAEPDIGIGFIEAAGKALKRGGRLMFVANRQLPYEAVLEKTFAKVERLAEDGAYKVIRAIRN